MTQIQLLGLPFRFNAASLLDIQFRMEITKFNVVSHGHHKHDYHLQSDESILVLEHLYSTKSVGVTFDLILN